MAAPLPPLLGKEGKVYERADRFFSKLARAEIEFISFKLVEFDIFSKPARAETEF